MAFHDEPFDEATLTKLDIFDQYLREWLPVFVSKPEPIFPDLHIFDFCAGPGTDGEETPGSPLRILSCLSEYAGESGRKFQGWNRVKIHAHFFDEKHDSVRRLDAKVKGDTITPAGITVDIRRLPFDQAFAEHENLFRNESVAKLLIIDQFGVSMVDDEIFKKLITFPTCDFLFFISSSTLHRFRDHPAIKQKIREIDDPHEVHLAVTDYYRDLIPKGREYFLSPFSIRKGNNIYGIIFGSGHPRAMDKFLQVAWETAPSNGTANFDIHREGATESTGFFPGFEPRTKIDEFNDALKDALQSGACADERALIRLCFRHGMALQKAKVPLAELKKAKKIETEIQTPQVKNWKEPRMVRRAAASKL